MQWSYKGCEKMRKMCEYFNKKKKHIDIQKQH